MAERRQNVKLRNLIDKALAGDDLTDAELEIICKPEIMAKLCEIRNAQKILNAVNQIT